MNIHPSAVIDSTARIGEGVTVGPHTVIGANVRVGAGTTIGNGVTIFKNVTIGENNRIFPSCSLGGPPQDLNARGADARLVIGDNNIIREFVSINVGSEKEDLVTVIGNNNFLMTCCHVAHDCVLENEVVLINNVLLAGHVRVQRRAILNGAAAVHPFTTIGAFAYVGGLTRIVQDVPPFMIVEGNPSKVRGVNIVGLKRGGFSDRQVGDLTLAYKKLFRGSRVKKEEMETLRADASLCDEVRYLVDFLMAREAGKFGRAREASRKK
jgi:UDP-N-acetylglucosamine acyltransferase